MYFQLPSTVTPLAATEGLPLHPLVVHFSVVLLPLAGVLLLLAAFVPPIRRRFLGLGVVLALAGVVATFVAKESGESLAGLVGTPERHERWGTSLLVVSLIFTAAAVAWWFMVRRQARAGDHQPDTVNGAASAGGLVTILGVLTAVLSVAVVVLSVLTGHSGAQATWGGAANTSASGQQAESASPTAESSADASKDSSTYTMEDVRRHGETSSCWAVVDSSVYDLTDWISQHPGGEGNISRLCGTDATEGFARQHGNNDQAKESLAEYKIGTLDS